MYEDQTQNYDPEIYEKYPIHLSPCHIVLQPYTGYIHRVSEKKTPTHIIGYKLKSSCLILIIFDINIPHKICHHMTA